MDRRVFLTTLAGGLLAAPLADEAQPAGKIPRIAFLTTTSPENSPTTDAFRQGLRELGYVEGQTINIDYRWGRGSTEHFARFAAEAVRASVDVIVAANTRAGQAAQQATRMIPIVITVIEDPSASGITSLARPGGNVTGISAQGPDLMAKRLQLLKEALPAATRIGLLVDTNNVAYRSHVEMADGAARGLGMSLHVREMGKPSDLDGALTSMKSDAVAGILVVGGTMFYAIELSWPSERESTGYPRWGVTTCMLRRADSWATHPVCWKHSGGRRRTWTRFSKAPSQATSPSSNPPSTNWSSTSRPPRPLA